MILFLAVQVFSVVLSLGPQVVLSTSEAITIQLSKVVQCEPVSLILTGEPHATPMWLTLVPFSSTPVFIPITNTSSTLNSVNVTFVPFVAGTAFVASLDDANHNSVAEVSDIVQVLPSPSGDVSCLVKSDGRAGSDYVLNTNTFSQCENFTLQYNRTAIFQAPTVRFFNPEGPSRLLKSTIDDTTTGVATYLLSFDRNKEVVLVFDDGAGHNASSAIMTVSGDVSSPVDCLATSASSRISMPAIIGISVGGGLVVVFLLLLFIFRKRRCRRADINSNAFITKDQLSRSVGNRSLSTPTLLRDDEAIFKGPSYTRKKHTSETTMASWSQPIPDDQQAPGRTSAHDRDFDDDADSLNSLKIEGMPHIVAVHENQTSMQTIEPVSLSSASIPGELPSPPHLIIRQPIRDPSEVESGHPSMLSLVSLTVYPFVNDSLLERHRQDAFTTSRQTSVRVADRVPLPTFPRHSRTMRDKIPAVGGVPEDVRLSSQYG